MRGCNIYPGLFQAYKCNECSVTDTCKNQEDDRYQWVGCKVCGYRTELKAEYVKLHIVICPFCKDRVLT